MNALSDRLKSARRMRGWSLQEMSDQLKNRVSKQSLHKYEQGVVVPDNYMLNELCYTLNIRPDYLYRQPVALGNLTFRKLNKLSATEQEIAIEKSKDLLARYLELESLVGLSSEFKNPIVQKIISGIDEAESAAQIVRENWQLGNDPLPSVVELLENNEIKVLSIEAGNGFDGMSTFANSEVPIIVLNKNFGVVRRRFTALHELGHLILKNNLPENIPEKEEEKLCHAFAAAMLLPKERLFFELGKKRMELNLRELINIEDKYGISVQAILYLAKKLEIITEYYYLNFIKRLNILYGKKTEFGKFLDIEQTKRFEQLLLRGISEEAFTMSKAAELNNMKLSEFRDFIKFEKEDVVLSNI